VTKKVKHDRGGVRPRAPHLALGAEGEERAARFLARRGYRIVGRNVRAGGVEIDIVARRGACIVFVEVKTRRSRRFGGPEEAVGPAKQRRLVRAAGAWLRDHDARARSTRFDVIAVLAAEPDRAGASRWQIRHIRAAFDASQGGD